MHITIDGFSGGMTPPNRDDAIAFALTLLLEGYSVRVNGLQVIVEYGPGYNSVIWGEGDYKGEALDARRARRERMEAQANNGEPGDSGELFGDGCS